MSSRKKIKVCHMTDAHPQEDIRIFHKECTSLAQNGYDVYHVSRGKRYEANGIHMIGIGEVSGNRLVRMTKAASKVYQAAKEINADVYHIHDPELLPYGLRLKKQGKKVIFDSHEDVPAQIMDKYWILKPFRRFVSVLYRTLETYAVGRFDAVITATPHIAKQFKGRAKKAIIINNYPKLEDIEFHDMPFEKREPIICYAGAINEIRGEKIMIEAMEGVKGILILAGEHTVQELGKSNMSIIKYIGNQSRKQVNELYGKSRIGVMIYQPAANHNEAMPNKLFEYMAAGLPIICSDFPIWKRIVEGNQCGKCVDPLKSLKVKEAYLQMINDPKECQKMGLNGRIAVEKKYNWIYEQKKLLKLYQEILEV